MSVLQVWINHVFFVSISRGSRVWLNVLIGGDCHQANADLVEQDQSLVPSPVCYRLPLKVLKHGCYADIPVVIIFYETGRSALDIF